MDTGIVTAIWREANVTAIFKNKGNCWQAGNYRPVSLISEVCKVMESFVRDSMMQHLEQNDLFSNQQYGFISGRQLLNVMDEWTSVLAEGGQIDVVYMDFQKAFDTVPHRRLLGKLESYGIRSKTKRWIASFLGDRRQRVMVNGTASEWRPVTRGILQGSVLGPGLFVVYINDLPKNVTSVVRLFADDTKVSRQIRKENDAREVQDDLHSLQGWSDMWLLKFHPQKCKFMQLEGKK